MKKLYIVFPGGAGGHWLSHLVYLLQHDDKIVADQLSINFHNKPLSENVDIRHWQQNDKNNWKVFSSQYSFNLYLQGFMKQEIYSESWLQSTFTEQFNNALRQAGYKFSNNWHKDYCQHIDLHYDLIFKDPNEFCIELFDLLDQAQIEYVPNKTTVMDSIEVYKQTLPSASEHFDNLNSFFWLAWCFGIMHHEKLPGNIDYSNCTKQDIVNSILPRKQYFAEYTKPYVLL